MNFFGIEISDAQFEAAMGAARRNIFAWPVMKRAEEATKKALGFDAGDVVAPPAIGYHKKVGLYSYLNPWWPW